MVGLILLQPMESGKQRHGIKSPLQILPVLPADARKQASSNVPSMRIWDPHSYPSFGHNLMPPSGVWTVETECSEEGY